MENINEARNNTEKKENKKYIWVWLFLVMFFMSSVIGAFFGFIAGGISAGIANKLSQKYPQFSKFIGKSESSNPEIIKERIIEEDSAVINVVDKATPAVVSIVISKDIPTVKNYFSNPFSDEFFERFFGESQTPQGDNNSGTEKKTVGMGTGFIVTSDGMIATNKHVVGDATADYTVITNDGKEFSAKVLAKDPVNDIAIVKIEGENFTVLSLGNSESLKIGQTVIAIGNSLGEFSNTVSRGIISGLRRNLTASSGFGESESLSGIIQTDAAINLGNSGGPLLNIAGEVIGVNVAKAQGAENIGFAIPSNQIKRIVDQVKANGKISTPYIGVRYLPIDSQIQKENNLPYNYGVLILRGSKITDFAVIPGSPADKSGLVENDIILEIEGNKIDAKNSLMSLLSKYNVGSEVTLKIWHKGEENMVKLTLEERQ